MDEFTKANKDMFTTVIKYKIVLKGKNPVWRRYSEFDKLMRYFHNKYPGILLPEIPPKEGINQGLTLLKGVDEAFLYDRQQRL